MRCSFFEILWEKGGFCTNLIQNFKNIKGSRHSSYTSHASRMSYTSHGDLLGGLGGNGKVMTKESQLRSRSMRNGPATATNNFTEFTHKAHRGDYVSKIEFNSLLFAGNFLNKLRF